MGVDLRRLPGSTFAWLQCRLEEEYHLAPIPRVVVLTALFDAPVLFGQPKVRFIQAGTLYHTLL